MQSDRELLELAAKAAGIETVYWNDGQEPFSSGLGFILPSNRLWNPLTDDGDALRLAVKLSLHIEWRFDGRVAVSPRDEVADIYCMESTREDKQAAARRAIVRAAAELGAQAHRDHKDGGA